MLPDDPRHGYRRGYRAHRNDGEDPCAACLRANARYKKQIVFEQHRGTTRKKSSVGVVRRIRALQRIGWSLGAIAEEMGVSRERVRHLAVKAPDYITPAAFERVDAAYNRLSMRLPEPSRFATWTRNYAEKQGWPPPLAWDDIDRDERPATSSNRSNYTSDELLSEWDFLRRSGLSMTDAATRLGITSKAIEKALTRARKVA